MRKSLLTVSGLTFTILAFGGVAIAGGVGPFSVGIGAAPATIHNLVKGPEKISTIDQRTGCDSSATSSNCANVKTSQPSEQAARGLSTATSYTEVAATKQSGKIDARLRIDNTLKGVSFCGTTFKTRQVVIGDVDVGQRIAQLASSDQMGRLPSGDSLGQGICNSMPHYFPVTKGILEMRDVTTFQSSDPKSPGENYTVVIGTEAFAINPVTNEIFSISAYDGSTLTSVGKLK